MALPEILEENEAYLRVASPTGGAITVPRAQAESMGLVQPSAAAFQDPGPADDIVPPTPPGSVDPLPSPVQPLPGADLPALNPQTAAVPTAQPTEPVQGAGMPAEPAAAPTPGAQPVADQQPAPTLAPGPDALAPLTVPEGMPQPETLEDVASLYGASGQQLQERGIRERAEIEQREQIAKAEAQERADAELAKLQAKQAAERDREEKRYAQLQRGLDAKVKAFGDAKVDQGRWWASRSTPQKILAGIGVALGAIGAAIQGKSQNLALDMIMKTIEQDVNLQFAAIDKMGKDIDLGRVQVGDFVKTMGNNEAARSAATAGYLARVNKQVEGIAARSASEQVKANATTLLGQLREKYAENLRKAGEGVYQRDVTERKLEEERRQAKVRESQGWSNIKLARDRFNTDAAIDLQKLDLERDKLLSEGKNAEAKALDEQAKLIRSEGVYLGGKVITKKDGSPLLLGTADRASAARDNIAAVSSATRLVDDLIRLRDKYGSEVDLLRSPEWQQMRSNFASLQLAAKDQAGLGVLSESDLKLLNNVFGGGDPTAMRDNLDGLKNFRKNAEFQLNDRLTSQGYDGAPVKFPKAFSASKGGDLDDTPTLERQVKQGILSRNVKERAGFTINLIENARTPDEKRQVAEILTEIARNPAGIPKDEAKTIRSFAAIARRKAGLGAVNLEPPKPQKTGIEKTIEAYR